MEETKEEMEQIFEITKALFKKILSKDTAKIYAQFLWYFYQELQKVGFTKEEALKLLKIPEWKGR